MSAPTIDKVVHDVYRQYSSARIRDFIPVLVENEARDRLGIPEQRAAGG